MLKEMEARLNDSSNPATPQKPIAINRTPESNVMLPEIWPGKTATRTTIATKKTKIFRDLIIRIPFYCSGALPTLWISHSTFFDDGSKQINNSLHNIQDTLFYRNSTVLLYDLFTRSALIHDSFCSA